MRSDKEIMQAHARSEFLRKTGNVIKMIAITNGLCTDLQQKGEKIKKDYGGGNGYCDIVVYNSSPNFSLPCTLLSHWLQAIANVFFQSELISHSRILNRDRFRYLVCQIFYGRQRFSQIASLIIYTVCLSLA